MMGISLTGVQRDGLDMDTGPKRVNSMHRFLSFFFHLCRGRLDRFLFVKAVLSRTWDFFFPKKTKEGRDSPHENILKLQQRGFWYRITSGMDALTNRPSQVTRSSHILEITLRAVCLSFLKIIPFRASQIRHRIARRMEGQTSGSVPGTTGETPRCPKCS